MRLEELQHFPVELVAPVVLVSGLNPVAVENPESAAQVPHRPTPAGLFPKRKDIGHPADAGLAGGFGPAAPFADMDWNTLVGHRLPPGNQFGAQLLLVPKDA